MNEQQEFYIILLIIPVLFILIIAMASLIKFKLVPFLTRRRYLKMEIMRSDVEEYECWKQRIEELYMEYFPVLGFLIKIFNK